MLEKSISARPPLGKAVLEMLHCMLRGGLMIVRITSLFGLIRPLSRSTLVRGGHRMVGLGRLMRSLARIALVVAGAAASVLRAILVSLLRAGSKMLRPRAAVAPSHWSALLAWVKDRLVILDIGAHAIHGLSLLRALVRHHRRGGTSGTGVSVDPGDRLRSRWRHELRVAARIHHLRTRNHSLRTRYELRLHHHGTSHLALLRGHVLGVVGEATELSHLRRPRHKDGLVVGHLCWRVVGDRHIAEAG